MLKRNLVGVLILALVCTATVQAADTEPYKEYRPRSGKKPYFTISFDTETISFIIPGDDGEASYHYPLTAVTEGVEAVYIGNDIVLTELALNVPEQELPYDRIVDLRVYDDDGTTVIAAYQSLSTDTDPGRVRRGNLIQAFDNVVVDEETFVRGFVLSVVGNIDVFGEVSKDIVSLFGDVYVGPDAVARGDVASITGRVQVARDASVYGELFTGSKEKKGRSRRFYREEEEAEMDLMVAYDRVDGLTLGLQFKYEDFDSVLPFISADGGYALESERWRLKFEVEQVLSRRLPVSIGGRVFQMLVSEDDWIIEKDENTVFTLLFAEDYRDYYEARGGRGFFRSSPTRQLKFEAGYEYIETRWFRARRQLWSLFGGGKEFPRNFHRVEDGLRTHGIAELDSTTNAYLTFNLDFDTRDDTFPFESSAWALGAWLEWASPDIGSDFDYRRYFVNFRRYQEINRYTMLMLRGVFANSDGYLPMYKRYYLGGVGTLRGYKHKELTGTRFWLTNAEYRFRFPKSDLAVSVMYDIGQIANDTKLSGDIDVEHSLGLGLYLGDDVRLSLAHRLDANSNKNLQFYARFEHNF